MAEHERGVADLTLKPRRAPRERRLVVRIADQVDQCGPLRQRRRDLLRRGRLGPLAACPGQFALQAGHLVGLRADLAGVGVGPLGAA